MCIYVTCIYVYDNIGLYGDPDVWLRILYKHSSGYIHVYMGMYVYLYIYIYIYTYMRM
jgi:hypothetical protein